MILNEYTVTQKFCYVKLKQVTPVFIAFRRLSLASGTRKKKITKINASIEMLCCACTMPKKIV